MLNPDSPGKRFSEFWITQAEILASCWLAEDDLRAPCGRIHAEWRFRISEVAAVPDFERNATMSGCQLQFPVPGRGCTLEMVLGRVRSARDFCQEKSSMVGLITNSGMWARGGRFTRNRTASAISWGCRIISRRPSLAAPPGRSARASRSVVLTSPE